jgi:hypothetical protein
MARATLELVQALRVTASRLASGAQYRWTHLGACNCGHLAQTVTHHSPEQLRRWALERPGDWTERAIDYCPTSGYPIDHVISSLLELGLAPEDIGHLERLSCPRVLRRLTPTLRTELSYRERAHVVAYLAAWADSLEKELLGNGAARAAA